MPTRFSTVRTSNRGFTLLEMMVVVAIVGILAAMAFYGLEAATRSSRVSNARFTLTSAFDQARTHAMSRGVDTYLVFDNLESRERPVLGDPARILVVEDRQGVLRTRTGDLIQAIDDLKNEADSGVREVDRLTGGGISYENGWLTPTFPPDSEHKPDVFTCESDPLPPMRQLLNLSIARTMGQCSEASWCTFCEDQAGRCLGALRFAPDGSLRTVTGPAGNGGLLRIANLDNDARSFCLAYSEPAGVVMTY